MRFAAYRPRVFAVVFSLSVTLIFVVVVAPFDFTWPARSSLGWRMLLLGPARSDLFDVLKNVFLFVPFGWSLAGRLQEKGRKAGRVWLAVALASFVLSYGMELLQWLLPTRFPSYFDVLSNTFGGLCGFGLFQLGHPRTVERLARMRLRGRVAAVGLYLLLVLGVLLFVQQATSLRNWDLSYNLLLGNEQTGDRPWEGTIRRLALSTRAVPPDAARAFFPEAEAVLQDPNFRFARYDLTGPNFGRDRTGRLPRLVWRGRAPDLGNGQAGSSGVVLRNGAWLESARLFSDWSRAVRAASEFAVWVVAEPYQFSTPYLARIVSLSFDHTHRNLTLGQWGHDLVVRMRNPLVGENGSDPALRVRNVFRRPGPRRLLVTYDDAELRVYVDRPENVTTLTFRPWAKLEWRQLFAVAWLNWVAYKSFFYGLLFAPLGLALGLLPLPGFGGTASSAGRWMFLAALVALAAEASVALITQRSLSLVNFGFAFVCTFLPLLHVRGVRDSDSKFVICNL